MKTRTCAALLLAVLMISIFAGCAAQAAEEKLDVAEDAIENRIDVLEDAVENRVDVLEEAVENPADTPAEEPPDIVEETVEATVIQVIPTESVPETTASAAKPLTKEDAQAIALQHAGLTAGELLYLRTELDYDHGRYEYDVEFQVDRWEYDYEIHSETGEILSWDKDWDD